MFWTSLGYSQSGADRRLLSFMSQPRTLLIDLREAPSADYVQWDSVTLMRDYGKRYRQAGEYLGNKNYASGGPILIPRLEEGCEGLMRYLTEGWNIVLLCGCYNFCMCHRATVVKTLQDMLREHEMSEFADAYIIEDTPLPGMMNCLSVNQPFAMIIMRSHFFLALEQIPKEIECRPWMTPWRGKLAIHAGSSFDTGLFKNKMLDPLFWQDRFGTLAASVIPLHKDQYPLGAIIGVADLVDIVTSSGSPWYVQGQYGFVLKNICPIDPIPYKGLPRLFSIPEEVLHQKLYT